MIKIHAISTGRVQLRRPQMESRGNSVTRMTNMLFAPDWSDWLPIHVWIIEHDEGLILVDTGETARVHEPGYHPRWHPFYRHAVRFSVRPEEELGPQLRVLGIGARDIRHVVLTHLHTDHAGGLSHVVGSRTWVAGGELARATGIMGRVQGYLPHRWPRWWEPEIIRFETRRLGPFEQSMSLTTKGDVVIVPTPGHTPDHVSVIIGGDVLFFLAGDASYSQRLLLSGKIDGISPNPEVTRRTHQQILSLAADRPLIYLPSHDSGSSRRLADLTPLIPGHHFQRDAIRLLVTR